MNAFTIEGFTAVLQNSFKGKKADILVDLEDLHKVSPFPNNWHVSEVRGKPVVRHVIYDRHNKDNNKVVHLNRIVLNAQRHQKVIHIDGNHLNCRKSNLRLETIQRFIPKEDKPND